MLNGSSLLIFFVCLSGLILLWSFPSVHCESSFCYSFSYPLTTSPSLPRTFFLENLCLCRNIFLCRASMHCSSLDHSVTLYTLSSSSVPSARKRLCSTPSLLLSFQKFPSPLLCSPLLLLLHPCFLSTIPPHLHSAPFRSSSLAAFAMASPFMSTRKKPNSWLGQEMWIWIFF